MIYLWNGCIIIMAFLVMEVAAWTMHKYVMHGFLWTLHKDHHVPHNKKFEKNDFFALIFAIPSWLFMMFGIMAGCDARLYIGIGIAVYGFCYVMIHEGLIHGRIRAFTNPQSIYLLGLRAGHLSHHVHDRKNDYKKEEDKCYGMLWVPYRFFREARKIRNQNQNSANTAFDML